MILANKEAAEKFNFNKAISGTRRPLEHVIAGKGSVLRRGIKA